MSILSATRPLSSECGFAEAKGAALLLRNELCNNAAVPSLRILRESIAKLVVAPAMGWHDRHAQTATGVTLRTRRIVVIFSALLVTSACSSPHKASTEASRPDASGASNSVGGGEPGNAGNGGSLVTAGSGGSGGPSAGGTVGSGAHDGASEPAAGKNGSVGGRGAAGTGSPDAGADHPTDAAAAEPDGSISVPDAGQGEDKDAPAVSGGAGGRLDTGGGGRAMTGGAGENTVAGGADGSSPEGAAGESSPAAGAAGAATTETTPRPTLKKFVGNTPTEHEPRSDFLEYWDQLSTENEGKWGAVASQYMQYDWSRLDPLYAFTRQNHIPFHEVALLWQGSEPAPYLGSGKDAQRAAVEDWIRSFCTRYPDTELIDVVYEPPPHTAPTYRDAIGGAGTSGYDWIVQAFVWARKYCPKSILLMTDYNNIESQLENQNFIDIVTQIMAAGAPIDAIGAEGHDAYKLPTSTVQRYVDKLAATGLPIYITEYDIVLSDDAEQEAVMKEQFPLFWTDDRIKGITLWGYVEGSTWRTGSGLVSADGTPRPAMTWLMSYLGR
jgi:endo-1,4-beta-xylanase